MFGPVGDLTQSLYFDANLPLECYAFRMQRFADGSKELSALELAKAKEFANSVKTWENTSADTFYGFYMVWDHIPNLRTDNISPIQNIVQNFDSLLSWFKLDISHTDPAQSLVA